VEEDLGSNPGNDVDGPGPNPGKDDDGGDAGDAGWYDTVGGW
jgi:hypothetical protein